MSIDPLQEVLPKVTMAQTGAKSSEQRTAEAEVESFRRDLGPFVVAAETTRMPMAFTDAVAPGDRKSVV